MHGVEACGNHLQHGSGSGQYGKQRRLGLPLFGWIHRPHLWCVLRSHVATSVLRLRWSVQRRRYVLLQPALCHQLRGQGNRAACGGVTAA